MIHLSRAGRYLGYFDISVVHQGLENGLFRANDLAREDEHHQWEALSIVLLRVSAPQGVLLVEAWRVWTAQAYLNMAEAA